MMEIVYLADYPDFAPILAEWHYQEWNRLHANDSVARRSSILEPRPTGDEFLPCSLPSRTVSFEVPRPSLSTIWRRGAI